MRAVLPGERVHVTNRLRWIREPYGWGPWALDYWEVVDRLTLAAGVGRDYSSRVLQPMDSPECDGHLLRGGWPR